MRSSRRGLKLVISPACASVPALASVFVRAFFLAALVLGIASGIATAATGPRSLGPGHGIALPRTEGNPCPGEARLLLNYDGSAETGLCYEYGNAPPDWGAWAECYSDTGTVCGAELQLTGVGYPCRPCDLYVWADADGVPGDVLILVHNADPCPVATWPEVSTHDFSLPPLDVEGSFWIGYWADFSQQACGYFVAADTDGPGGCPMTNIPPEIGYPTGWHDVSLIWGPIQAIGLGVWVLAIPPTPVQDKTWGRVKSLYR
jgi:hypothetical protein